MEMSTRETYNASMTEHHSPLPFVLPPHANAEVHKRLMEDLDRMTPAEFFETLVRAGIYTPEGELTEHYRSGPSEPSDSCPPGASAPPSSR
jgi:hypothetical protein